MTNISHDEQRLARERAAAKRAKVQKEAWSKTVKLHVAYLDGVGTFAALYTLNSTHDGMRLKATQVEFGMIGPDGYRRVVDFIEEMKARGYNIVNLPRSNDNRFYVKQLYAMQEGLKGSCIGILKDNGKTKYCYTLDDLLEAEVIDTIEPATEQPYRTWTFG